MLIPTTQKVLLALTTTALLLTTATAQNGTRSTEVPRDPFVQQNSANPPVPTVNPSTRKASTARPTKTSKASPERELDSQIEVIPSIPLPPITVTGIVSAPGNRQAILRAGSTSLVVTEGQRVADYQVKSINATSVTFSTFGQDFRINLAQ